MDRLYAALYSSLTYFRSRDELEDVHSYVAWRGGEVEAVFLFRQEGAVIRVINEGIRIKIEDVQHFVHHVFTELEVKAVIFNAVRTDPSPLAFVHQRFFSAEDFVVQLPDTPEAYTARLGSATRKNIKRHKNRIEKAFPSFAYQMYEGHEVDEQDIRAIIEMNRARMLKKSAVSYFDEAETLDVIRLVRAFGVVGLAKIEGRACAGSIVFRVGRNYFSRVNAHDPEYDDFRLGMVTCYMGICECIKRGGIEFHLGPMKYDYKTALLGAYQASDHLVVYRSSIDMLLCAPLAIRTFFHGLLLSRHIMDGDLQKGSFLSRQVRKAFQGWRALKRYFAGAGVSPDKNSK